MRICISFHVYYVHSIVSEPVCLLICLPVYLSAISPCDCSFIKQFLCWIYYDLQVYLHPLYGVRDELHALSKYDPIPCLNTKSMEHVRTKMNEMIKRIEDCNNVSHQQQHQQQQQSTPRNVTQDLTKDCYTIHAVLTNFQTIVQGIVKTSCTKRETAPKRAKTTTPGPKTTMRQTTTQRPTTTKRPKKTSRPTKLNTKGKSKGGPRHQGSSRRPNIGNARTYFGVSSPTKSLFWNALNSVLIWPGFARWTHSYVQIDK